MNSKKMKLKKLSRVLVAVAAFTIALSSCKKSDTTTTPTGNGGGGGGTVNTGPADSVSTKYAGGILGNANTHSTFTFLAGKTYNITKGNVILVNADVTVQAGAKLLFGGVPLKVTIGFNGGHIGHDHPLKINIPQIEQNIALNNKKNAASLKTLSLSANTKTTSLTLPAPDTGSKSNVYSIYVTGGKAGNKSSFVVNGTSAAHAVFTTQESNPQWPNGYWGGINIDSSATKVTLEWADISHTGGSDSIAGNQYAIYVAGPRVKGTTPIPVTIENSSVEYGVDDCTRMEGQLVLAIRGNVFKRQGSNDGDGINIKAGSTGDVCYNYCWSGANNSIKLNANKKDHSIVTNVNIYNNTIIEGGWRKVGEASSGILIDAFAKGACYNNLIIECRNGFTLTGAADTSYYTGGLTGSAVTTHHNALVNNNFIYAIVDSTAANSYGFKQWGNKQPNDISALTVMGQTNPLIKTFDPNTIGYTNQPNSYPDNNDPHLQSTSPAIGKGFSTNTYYNAGGVNYSSQWAPGEDIGAFQVTSSTRGNLRGNN